MAAFFKINCLFPLFCGRRILPAFQALTFKTQVSAAVRENVIGGGHQTIYYFLHV